MGRHVKDLAGQRFGVLIVIGRHSVDCPIKWACLCDCGNSVIVRGSHLKDGTTKGCGCLRRAAGDRTRKHGLGHSAIYRVWESAKRRCTDPNHPQYGNYGGRGITMCEAWLNDAGRFASDMGPRPQGAFSRSHQQRKGILSRKLSLGYT